MVPRPPPPLMRSVSVPFSSLSRSPSIDAAHRLRPRAAIAVGLQWWMALARCTASRAVTTEIFTKPSFETARMISSIGFTSEIFEM